MAGSCSKENLHIFSRNFKQQRLKIFFIEFLFVFCYKKCNKEKEQSR